MPAKRYSEGPFPFPLISHKNLPSSVNNKIFSGVLIKILLLKNWHETILENKLEDVVSNEIYLISDATLLSSNFLKFPIFDSISICLGIFSTSRLLLHPQNTIQHITTFSFLIMPIFKVFT